MKIKSQPYLNIFKAYLKNDDRNELLKHLYFKQDGAIKQSEQYDSYLTFRFGNNNILYNLNQIAKDLGLGWNHPNRDFLESQIQDAVKTETLTVEL